MLTFSPATEADIPALRDLARRIWHAHYPGIIAVDQINYMLDRFFSEQHLREELKHGVRWEIASHGGQRVGFLACFIERDNDQLKLSKLYLLPELHGRGFGREMLERVKGHATKDGLPRVCLTVNRQNAKAIRAYERAGFAILETVMADIGDGYYMDDYLMAWTGGTPDATARTTTAVP